jgi:hypothetical protein
MRSDKESFDRSNKYTFHQYLIKALDLHKQFIKSGLGGEAKALRDNMINDILSLYDRITEGRNSVIELNAFLRDRFQSLEEMGAQYRIMMNIKTWKENAKERFEKS